MALTLHVCAYIGVTTAVVGLVALLSTLFGLIPAHTLGVGETSGVRIAATIAVGGCLLAALGFGGIEYLQRRKPKE